jgi:UDP:flavonoid glycosyltransferase YjiC (YdhE family)
MVVRVFQTLIAFSGNAPPQLAVTRELVERGHEVRVLAHRATRERVERTGAEFVEFRRTFPDMDITRRETDTLRDWEPRTPVGYVRALLKTHYSRSWRMSRVIAWSCWRIGPRRWWCSTGC